MNLRLLTLPVILSIVLGAASERDAAEKRELAKMEGVWQVVSGEEDGNPSSEYLVQNLKWEFKGDRLTFKDIKPLTDKASKLTIKLDVAANPKCIDLKVEEGSLKCDVLEGVYEWKGEELRICLYTGMGNRPSEFDAKAGSSRVLFLLKREKP